MRLAVCALVLWCAAEPAAALISNIKFHGSGVVTTTRVGDNPQFPPPTPPPVGTPVTINGILYFGDYALPDDFSGVFTFDEDELKVSLGQGFAWTIESGDSRASTFSGNFAYAYGKADFVGGRLIGVDLYLDDDGIDDHLYSGGWATNRSYQDASWSGTWALSVPEPRSWAMMFTGFTLAGAALRARRALAW